METEILLWSMVAIVGTVGVLKNLIKKGGRKVWTVITIIVGVIVAYLAMKLPIKALQVWVAVTGATLFYDTIFKAFEKLINKMEDKILLEMQQQLGRIEATTIAVKDDIAELKQKDITQSENLEKAYAKAKARQDSIRDDLQHQIDGQKTLILTVNESINSLNKNIESMFKEYKKDINDRIDGLETRIIEVETKKEKTLVKWYDKIADKLVNAFLIAGGVILLKWLNVPHEVVGQFSK